MFRGVTPRALNLDETDKPVDVEFKVQERKPRIIELAKLDLSDLIARDVYGGDINAKLQVRGSGNSRKDLAGELEHLVDPSRLGDLVIQPSEVRIVVGSERVRVERFQVQTTALTAALEGEVDLAGRSGSWPQRNWCLKRLARGIPAA